MSQKTAIAIFAVLAIIGGASVVSFGAGLQQGYADAKILTVTSTILIAHNGTRITNSFFAAFIDKTPQLRLAWGLLPFNVSVDRFVMTDVANKTLISFDSTTGASNFANPYLDGMPIGFKALSHDVHVGDFVYITLYGHSGGAETHWTYQTQIGRCNPNVTWC